MGENNFNPKNIIRVECSTRNFYCEEKSSLYVERMANEKFFG